MIAVRAVILLASVVAMARDVGAQDSAITRLAPSAFKSLPANARADLDRRGCRIPQVSDEPGPNNVVTGAFLDRDTKDWAVLCSVNRTSRVLVYSANSTAAVDSLDAAPDDSFLQGVRGGRLGFSRMISTVPQARARSRARLMSSRPAITHDAIEIAFVDKASSIFYWNGKRWIELPGSD